MFTNDAHAVLSTAQSSIIHAYFTHPGNITNHYVWDYKGNGLYMGNVALTDWTDVMVSVSYTASNGVLYTAAKHWDGYSWTIYFSLSDFKAPFKKPPYDNTY
jgi:hypothetical protein